MQWQYHLSVKNNKGEGLNREGGFITFLPLERRGLVERGGLFERVGWRSLIEDLQYSNYSNSLGWYFGSLDLEWRIQHNSVSEMYNYRSAVGNKGKKATKKGENITKPGIRYRYQGRSHDRETATLQCVVPENIHTPPLRGFHSTSLDFPYM